MLQFFQLFQHILLLFSTEWYILPIFDILADFHEFRQIDLRMGSIYYFQFSGGTAPCYLLCMNHVPSIIN